MLARLTSKNQITIPKRIIDQIPDARYFEVELRDGVVVLRPLKTHSTSLEEIRAKVEKLDLDPECVREAVKWARSK
jgi:bifunctional DNA-binding transcriptional regulator/antitoxin component of YhaV-PrlF toxin-antitoxin module